MSARGFVLLPVLSFILVLAVLAYGASRSGPAALAEAGRAQEAAAARYLAEAGLAHASWQAQQASCSGYADLTNETFAGGSYDASYSGTSGTPVSVSVTGTLASGAAHVLTRSIDVYQPAVTAVLQPGPEGGDTFLDSTSGGTSGDADDARVSGQSGELQHALLRFDLSSVPALARVRSARLELYAYDVDVLAPAVVSVHRVTRAWDEADADWVSYGTGDWSTPGGDYVAVPAGEAVLSGSLGWQAWELGALVQGWASGGAPNHGVLLAGDANLARARFHSSDTSNATLRPKLVLEFACPCGVGCDPVAERTTLVLSALNDASLSGLSFQDGDLVEHDREAASAIIILREVDVFAADEDIDAAYVYADGRIVLSTQTAARLAGLDFEDEDLVEYDPAAASATLIFDGSARFSGDEDVDAAHLYADGRIVLSTETAASLAGLAFEDEDLVEYHPPTNVATLIFDGSAHFAASENVDAAQVLNDGRFLLSTDSDATLGGLSFTDADVVLYDPLQDTTVRVFDGASLTSSADVDVDAVHDFRPYPLTDELRLEPVADTYIDSGAPATAFGSATNLRIGNTLRTLLRFDLSTLPATATLSSAALYLNLDASAGALTVGAYQVTAAWDESTATWSSTGGGSFAATPVAAAVFSASPALWIKWTLPIALIQEWRDGVSPNYGLLLKPTSSTPVQTAARSRDHTSSAVHPRLVLTYTLP